MYYVTCPGHCDPSPQTCGTPHSLPFLHVLQSLLLLEREGSKTAAVWELMESLTQQAVLLEDPQVQGPKLLVGGLEKLREALQEEQNRQKNQDTSPATSAPAVPGAPPPPPPPTVPGAPPPPPPPGMPGGVPPPPPFPGGGAPPPPPFPGGGAPPPPPIPGGGFAGAAVTAAMMTKFEAARRHKPQKPMKKLNWVKVSQREASSNSALWSKSLRGEFDTKVMIDPSTVEELFSRAEVKKAKKGEAEGDKKDKHPSVVSPGLGSCGKGP